jgi:hypothetical protein
MGLHVQRVGHTFQKDGGIDFVFYPEASTTFPFLGAVQVKHHRSENRKTGPAHVREFAGSVRSGPFNAGLLITNTSFSADAQWVAAKHSSLVRLRGLKDLRRWFQGNFTDETEWREIPSSIELCPGIFVELNLAKRFGR